MTQINVFLLLRIVTCDSIPSLRGNSKWPRGILIGLDQRIWQVVTFLFLISLLWSKLQNCLTQATPNLTWNETSKIRKSPKNFEIICEHKTLDWVRSQESLQDYLLQGFSKVNFQNDPWTITRAMQAGVFIFQTHPSKSSVYSKRKVQKSCAITLERYFLGSLGFFRENFKLTPRFSSSQELLARVEFYGSLDFSLSSVSQTILPAKDLLKHILNDSDNADWKWVDNVDLSRTQEESDTTYAH